MKKFLFVVLILAAATLTACGSGGSSAPAASASVPADYAGKTNPFSADTAAGAEIFKVNCVPCHGEQGHRDGPAGAALDPKPKNLAVLQQTAGDDYLYWRVDTGKEGTSMMAWHGVLTDEQIWQVVAFIRTLKP